MAVIQSAGALERLERSWSPTSVNGSVSLYESRWQDYAALWRTQPNVRLVTSFISRNIAQLNMHVFERRSDTDRVRVTDTPFARVIAKPNPQMSRYRWVRDIVHDMCIYDDAFAVKSKLGDDRVGLIRVPPRTVRLLGDNWLEPSGYEVRGNHGNLEIPRDKMLHFPGYNPDDPRHGLSPLETLRRILAEEQASGDYRENFWRNAARSEGYISRPLDAPDWSDDARNRFRADWMSRHTGAASSGSTPLLEDGMQFQSTSFSAKDSEYLSTRKLAREEVAAAYFIPPSMVGILEHANFANMNEQHKALYADALPPWCTLIEEELMVQLAEDFDLQGVYVEFNLAEKLKGTFEEQASVIQTMVGAPVMTRAEARARLNLPEIDDPTANELVTPLNVLIGGQASPTDSAPPPKTFAVKALPSDETVTVLTNQYRDMVTSHFRRQQQAVLSRAGANKTNGHRKAVFERERWDAELASDLFWLNTLVADETGAQVVAEWGGVWTVEDALAWLEENARVAAENINLTTAEQIDVALGDPDDPIGKLRNVFTVALGARAGQIAQTMFTNVGSFGRMEGARKARLGTKRWVVRSGNPRSSHSRMNGQTVGITERFSNGAMWPGDPALGVDERAGCTCTVEFDRE